MLLFIMFLFIPSFFMQNYLLYQSISSMTESQSNHNLQVQLEAVNKALGSRFQELATMVNLISTDESCLDLALDDQSEHPILHNEFLNATQRYRVSIQDPSVTVEILRSSGELITERGVQEVNYSNWLTHIGLKQPQYQPTNVLYIYDEELSRILNKTRTHVHIIKQLNSLGDRQDMIGGVPPESVKREAYIIASVPIQTLSKSVYSYIDFHQTYFLLDRQDQLVFVVNHLGVNITKSERDNLSSFGSGQTIKSSEGQDYYVTYANLAQNNWLSVVVSNYADMFESAVSTYQFYFRIILVVTILVLILIIVVIRRAFQPLKELADGMTDVIDGDLKTRVQVKGEDEIGFLSKQFNLMLDSIERLVESINIEYSSRQRTEIALLQNQINPHFLYNTLAAARYLNVSGKVEETDVVLRSITVILRNAISNQAQFIQLEEEMDLAKEYLKIQSVLYENEFVYEFEFPENSKTFTVPKFILQPILENSFFHGFKKLERLARLKIKVYLSSDEVLSIYIIDNGQGSAYKFLYEPKNNMINLDRHIALRNINRRLHLIYGSNYSFSFWSRINLGSVTRIEIRERKEGDDKKDHEPED